eukprot:GILJ01011620.1.p1 GENE.GILJ01011620.1~~GILJ01011620.1.p1  ORF type:complete len:370 (+),score=35.62 GILJ01011620.1:49-1158(+)
MLSLRKVHFWCSKACRSRILSSISSDVTDTISNVSSPIIVKAKDLQDASFEACETIRAHNVGRYGGCFFYPSISLFLTYPTSATMLLYTPICVLTHHLCVKHTQRSLTDLLVDGEIALDSIANTTIQSAIRSAAVDRFYVNRKADLILFHSVRHQVSTFAKVGACHLPSSPTDKAAATGNGYVPSKLLQKNVNVVSLYHLRPEVRHQIVRILRSRSRRFRFPLFAGSALLAIGVVRDISTFMIYNDLSIFESLYDFVIRHQTEPLSAGTETSAYFGLGAASALLTEAITRTTHSNEKKLWQLIQEHPERIVDEKHIHLYPRYQELVKSASKEHSMFVYVTMFGDLYIGEKKPPFCFRKGTRLSLQQSAA